MQNIFGTFQKYNLSIKNAWVLFLIHLLLRYGIKIKLFEDIKI
jgi:hypothetical protein